MKKLYIKTYGCQMNEYDSEKVAALLSKTHQITSDIEQADTIFINTCSVREKAEHKLYSLLGTLEPYKAKGVKIGVGGCVAQQEGKKIAGRSGGVVNFVVGTHNLSLVPALVESNEEKAQIAVDYREEWDNLPAELDFIPPKHDEVVSGYRSNVRAMVAIQRGCSKMCSFCVVPSTRGKEVSRDPDEILREIRRKVMLGAREVMLLGQTVNSYGKDLSPRVKFSSLVRRIAEIDGLERIRFTSPHPQDVRPDFIELYAETPKLCPHIHLPLQSGSDRILKLMNRNYRVSRYLDIVAQLKDAVPGIAVSTDIIVGFPTETEEDFEQTLEVMNKVKYLSSFSFVYSRRPNTAAIRNFNRDEEVKLHVAKTRLGKLQKRQREHSQELLAKYKGLDTAVLVEGLSSRGSSTLKGRNPENVLVEVTEASENDIGKIISARVESAGANGLSARKNVYKNSTSSSGISAGTSAGCAASG